MICKGSDLFNKNAIGEILSWGDFVAGGFCHAVPKNCVGCGEKVARHSPTRSK